MKIFYDTCALVKKYIHENGRTEVIALLDKTTQLGVSFLYLIEMNSLLNRKKREKTISGQEMALINNQVNMEYLDFRAIELSEDVFAKTIDIANRYPLTTLDSIQLASACIYQPELFVTADKQLYKYAKLELDNVKLI